MASLTTFPLMDASRDSRIHDWIAEQYSFALSEFQDDDCLWRDDPPSLRESKLLPDDFDLIAPPPPPPRRDTDSDRDSQSTHSYEPPLLPSPLSLTDAQSPHSAPQGSANVEDALDGLIREMNSWRFSPANRSALTLTLSDRNKVCLAPLTVFCALFHARHSGTPRTAILTSDSLLGGLSLAAADCSIIAHVFHFSRYPQVFFPPPPSTLEGSRSMPPYP
jgi:hypothetical protein